MESDIFNFLFKICFFCCFCRMMILDAYCLGVISWLDGRSEGVKECSDKKVEGSNPAH